MFCGARQITRVTPAKRGEEKDMLKNNLFIDGKSTWMAEGLFEKQADAENACINKKLFVIEVKPNEMFPKKATQAINIWWPK